MTGQMSLPIDPSADAWLSDFAGPSWMSLIDLVRQLHTGLIDRLYIHAGPYTGKTHLLSAICGSFVEMGQTAIQVSLTELLNAPTESLAALEFFDLVALDDLEVIQGNPAWEEAIFHLINRSMQGEVKLIFASRLPPQGLSLKLPDLASRLLQATVFRMPETLQQADRQAVLEAVLERRGWQLDARIVNYLLVHGPSRPGLLLKILDEVGERFERQRRRPSPSFIRQTLQFIEERLQAEA